MRGHQSFLGSPPVVLPLGGEAFPFILDQPPNKPNATRQGTDSISSIVSQPCHSLKAPMESQELKVFRIFAAETGSLSLRTLC